MQPSEQEHISAATLEEYSLRKLDAGALETADCHLLVCAACRDWLTGIEPFNSIHHTPEGPFYSRITALQDGSFWAHHWGCQIHGGMGFHDLDAGRAYLLASFAQMFPEHECGEACW